MQHDSMIQFKVTRLDKGSCINAMPLCCGGCIPNHVDEDVLKEVETDVSPTKSRNRCFTVCTVLKECEKQGTIKEFFYMQAWPRGDPKKLGLKRVDPLMSVLLFHFRTKSVQTEVGHSSPMRSGSHGASHSWKSQFFNTETKAKDINFQIFHGIHYITSYTYTIHSNTV